MEALGLPPITVLTAPALLLIAVWLILVGRLVPRKTYEDVLTERNDWKEAHQISEKARAEMAKQVEELLEHARTTDALIRALPRVGSDR